MTLNLNTPKSDDVNEPKKPYNAPELLIYGSVGEITRNLGGTVGKNDGGGGPDKTGF